MMRIPANPTTCISIAGALRSSTPCTQQQQQQKREEERARQDQQRGGAERVTPIRPLYCSHAFAPPLVGAPPARPSLSKVNPSLRPLPPVQNRTQRSLALPHRPTSQPPTFSQASVCHCFRSLHTRGQDAKRRRTETPEPPHARARAPISLLLDRRARSLTRPPAEEGGGNDDTRHKYGRASQICHARAAAGARCDGERGGGEGRRERGRLHGLGRRQQLQLRRRLHRRLARPRAGSAQEGAALQRRPRRRDGRQAEAPRWPRDGDDEGAVREAAARRGHVRERQGRLHGARHRQRHHQPLRHHLRAAVEAGAAAAGEEGHVAAGDGLAALHQRPHRGARPHLAVLPRRNQARDHDKQATVRLVHQPASSSEARPYAPRNPGQLQGHRVLVRGPRDMRGGLRRLRLVPGGLPPPRRQMVAAGAPGAARGPPRQDEEAVAAQARLREPDPQGRHGHQQQRLGRDGCPRIVPRLSAKEREGDLGRRDIPLHNVGSLLPRVPPRQPGPVDGVPGPGDCQPRRGVGARVAPQGSGETGERLGPHRQRQRKVMEHGEGHVNGLGEEGAARGAGRGPVDMPQAEVPCTDADKPGHEQNPVQQGCGQVDPGELLEGSGEPGVEHRGAHRRPSQHRRAEQARGAAVVG